MPKKQYKDWNPDQQLLIPPSLKDWLPEDHPVYLMFDILEELDLSAIDRKYQQKDARGERPYAPKMMVGLLLYGYSVGVRSSRKLEKATYEDIPFRVLAADTHPDHTRISEFRRKHLQELEALFLQVFKICQRAGLVELGNVALDGTKVQASASKHQAMSYERMLKEEERLQEERLQEEIQEMLDEAEATDAIEDERYGRDARGDELPEDLRRRQDRLATIKKAKVDLEKEAKQGRAEAVEAKADRAKGRATEHESERERKRSATLAERWEEEAAQLRAEAEEQAGAEALAPESPEGMPHHRPKAEIDGTPKPGAQRNFTDPDSRIMEKNGEFLQGYNCQLVVEEAHQIIVAQGLTNTSPDNGNFGPMLRKAACNAGESPDAALADSGYWSPEALACAEELDAEAYIATKRQPHGKKAPSRSGPPPDGASAHEKMGHRLRTREGLDRYAKRKAIVEPVNGQIKEIGGFRRFGLRGYEKSRGEWALVSTGHNLKKLIGAMQEGEGPAYTPGVRPN